MKSAKIDVFFSCSFRDDDKELNEYFKSICSGLDVNLVNVDKGHVRTPPSQAKKMITDSQALIAIATKRTEGVDKKFMMPSAVREEISMAYGLDTPILLLKENGVELDGFMGNFGTHFTFERDKVKDNKIIEQIISSIHGLKMDVVSPHDLVYDQDISEFYAENIYHLVELITKDGEFCWVYSSTKKIIFQKQYKRKLNTGFWATTNVKVPDGSPLMECDVKVDGGSRCFTITKDILRHKSDCYEASLKIDPAPVEDDYIEYSTIAKSKFLNPIFKEDMIDPVPIAVGENNFFAFDGVIPIQRTKKATIEFRLPREFGLKKDDVQPFVGSYTSNVDYVVESEIKRSKITKESFGGNITIRMEVDSPLLRHIYGIAWNPPEKKC